MEKIIKNIPTGTKEWASSNVNLISGCSHNCRYCYAKKMAIRFGRKDDYTWKVMELNKDKLNQEFKKRKGRIMFPSSHDIVPEFKDECFLVLEKLLDAEIELLQSQAEVERLRVGIMDTVEGINYTSSFSLIQGRLNKLLTNL